MSANTAVWTVEGLSRDLAAGRTTSRALVEQALKRIADPAGEGKRAVMKTYADSARADADHADRLRKAGIIRSAVDGLTVTGKPSTAERMIPALRSRSAWSASARAESAYVFMTARLPSPAGSAMRLSACSTSARLVVRPAARSRESPSTVQTAVFALMGVEVYRRQTI